MNRTPESPEAGFTLVEAVVALTLSVIVAGLVGSVYLFAVRAVSEWQDRIDVDDTAHVIHYRLSTDLRRADAIHVVTTDSLVLSGPDGVQSYAYRDRTLFRNGVRLTQDPVTIPSFSVRRIATDSTVLLGPGPSPDGLRYVAVTVQIARPGATLERTASAALRAPSNWIPSSRR